MSIDARTPVTELLGDDLRGERVICAIQASTQRWYTPLTALLSRGMVTGRHLWWLALTDTRVFIVRRGDDTAGSTATRSNYWTFQAPRSETVVKHFTRTGVNSWWLVLQLGPDRWSLHSLTVFGTIPFFGSTYRNAKPIAESLGWKPRSRR